MERTSIAKDATPVPQKKKARLPKKNTLNSHIRRGRWDNHEHELFVEGLAIYGRQWKVLADLIKTRTAVQIRSHAQKHFQKLQRVAKGDDSAEDYDRDDEVNKGHSSHTGPKMSPKLNFMRSPGLTHTIDHFSRFQRAAGLVSHHSKELTKMYTESCRGGGGGVSTSSSLEFLTLLANVACNTQFDHCNETKKL